MQLTRVAIAIALLGGTAHAFPTGDQFDSDPVMFDGGGGIPFDGAPRWQGHTCAVCHTNAPGIIGLTLEADQPALFATGWQPSTQYHLRVVMQHEHEGVQYAASGDNCGPTVMPYTPCDQNGFALEFDTAAGAPTGTFGLFINNACVAATPVPIDPPVHVLADGSAVIHAGLHYGLTSWDLCWTSPAAGVGTITAYLAAVDGNGGDGTINFPNDTTGDDVAAGAVPLAEANAAPPPAQSGGCNAGSDVGVAIAIVICVLVLTLRRRAVTVLAIAALGGCVHVRPRQRETLAKRNMKFSPDPAEDELDLHMQEAREGSSGGYGSSGGGCGCN